MFDKIFNHIDDKPEFGNYSVFDYFYNKLCFVYLVCEIVFYNQFACNY